MKGAIIKLRQVLKLSRCNHKKEILKQSNLKTAHIYCKINNLSGQISGPLIEFYIHFFVILSLSRLLSRL